ncbi:MAG TPA: hypothetical protein VN931_08295, partial [Fibrobacteria bacterium]|nr:hypothetical protein [Fibrobacteria bacterium]
MKWEFYNSVAAWGDTLFDLSVGKIFRYTRSTNGVNLVDSIASGFGEALLKSAPGAPYSMVTVDEDSSKISSVPLDGSAMALQSSKFYLGNVWAGGGWVFNPADSQSTNPEKAVVVCGDLQAFRLRQINPGTGLWMPDDSLVSKVTYPGPTYHLAHNSVVVPASLGLNTHCDIDGSSRWGVIALVPEQPGSDSYMYVGSGNAWNLLSMPMDSIPFSADVIFSGWSGQWLAGQSGGHCVLRRTASGVLDSDSISNPGYSTPLVAPVRHDSLVVFAIDSLQTSLVLAKWTPDTFFFVDRISLGTQIASRGFMAIGDSTLWIQTDSSLLSFRISWQEARNSAIEQRHSLVGQLKISEGPMGTGFLWNGSAPAIATIQGIDGRVVDRIRL